jgi:hypothetical protein
MANTHRYGIRFVRSISGNDTPQIFTHPIASGYAPVTVVGAGSSVNLNIGDPVKFAEDGTLMLTQTGQDSSGANADSDDYSFGVIVGFPRVIVGGYPRPGGFYTSGTTYSGGIGGDNAPLVSVIPVAGNIFEIDANAVIGAGTKNAAMAVVGQTARIAYSVLSSGNGQPKANPRLNVADLAAGGANQLQLLVVGLGKAGDAMDFSSSDVTLQVMFTALDLAQQSDPAIFGANVE